MTATLVASRPVRHLAGRRLTEALPRSPVQTYASRFRATGSSPKGTTALTDWQSQSRGPGLKRRIAYTLFASLLLASSAAQAQSVALAGMLGGKALLVVNGTSPKAVAAGDTHEGVKVILTNGDQAVIEQDGKRTTLRVGEAPVHVGANKSGGKGNRIVLVAGSGGHFTTAGQINGKAVQFMVDTGATSVAMGVQDAERAGINYKAGRPVTMSTANGTAQGFQVKLDSVRVGEVEVLNVDAVVMPLAMPFLLLGNSFLTRFQMLRDNDQMTLTKKY